MEIKRYLLSKSNNTRRKEKIERVEYIVITSSKYKGISALKNRNIIEKIKYKEDEELSCHYIVDLRGGILNVIPENERAICTNNVNIDSKSISIMLTINDKGEYTENEMKSLKKLIHKLVKKYNIKKGKIVTEHDINNSRRPVILSDEPIMLYYLLNS